MTWYVVSCGICGDTIGFVNEKQSLQETWKNWRCIKCAVKESGNIENL